MTFLLQEPTNSSLPPALVMLDTSNTSLFSDFELLDTIPSRDSDTVHVFYVKTGQKQAQDIVANVVCSLYFCIIPTHICLL